MDKCTENKFQDRLIKPAFAAADELEKLHLVLNLLYRCECWVEFREDCKTAATCKIAVSWVEVYLTSQHASPVETRGFVGIQY